MRTNAVYINKETETKKTKLYPQNQWIKSQIHFGTGDSAICGSFLAQQVTRSSECQRRKMNINQKNPNKTVGGGRGGAALSTKEISAPVAHTIHTPRVAMRIRICTS